MATIKSVLDGVDDLDDVLKNLYTAGDDGKFYLNLLDDIRTHPKTKALQNAHERTKEALQTAKSEAASLRERLAGIPDDFNAEKLAELQAKADAAGGVKLDEQLTALRAQLEEKHRRALEAKDATIRERDSTIEGLQSSIKGSKIDRELDAALDKIKVDPKHRRAVRALLRTDSKIEVAEDGEVVVQTAQGFPTPLTDYVADLADADLKPYLMQATGDGGTGGKGGGAGINPFLPAQWNKTAQAKLPADRKEALAKAAGFASAAQALASSRPLKTA
jgi:hypothetical protein